VKVAICFSELDKIVSLYNMNDRSCLANTVIAHDSRLMLDELIDELEYTDLCKEDTFAVIARVQHVYDFTGSYYRASELCEELALHHYPYMDYACEGESLWQDGDFRANVDKACREYDKLLSTFPGVA
jgi:hypothetical protein